MQVRSGSGTWIRRLGFLVVLEILLGVFVRPAEFVEVLSVPAVSLASVLISLLGLALIPLLGFALVRVFRLDTATRTRLHEAETELNHLKQEQDQHLRLYREKVDRTTETIEDRSFEIHYQPIVELESGRPVIFEALARFDDSRTPDAWFADAFDVGLGIELELATLMRASSDLSLLPGPVALSVNVSPATLMSSELLAVFSDSAVDADQVILELTEHAVIEDFEIIAAALGQLRDLGLRFAIDDAGSGYSGIRQLVTFRPDLIKIDRSIVSTLDTDRTRRAAVESLAHFAEHSSMSLVAEGVETESECLTLQEIGIELAQGYLWGRPAPLVEEFDVKPLVTAAA